MSSTSLSLIVAPAESKMVATSVGMFSWVCWGSSVLFRAGCVACSEPEFVSPPPFDAEKSLLQVPLQ